LVTFLDVGNALIWTSTSTKVLQLSRVVVVRVGNGACQWSNTFDKSVTEEDDMVAIHVTSGTTVSADLLEAM
jgi:hypothetical protein